MKIIIEPQQDDKLEAVMSCAIHVSADAKVPVSFKMNEFEIFVQAGRKGLEK